jgi:HAD superfamily hydrolase (TIGR01549 family)
MAKRLLYRLSRSMPQPLVRKENAFPNVETMDIRGLVFDMDGTLTVPVLDFVEMKRRLGFSAQQDIVATLKSLNGSERHKAETIIQEMELEAMFNTKLQPNLINMLEKLEELHIPKAILTRNFSEPVNHLTQVMLEDKFKFDPCLDRDWQHGRAKPHPDALHYIAKGWDIPEGNILMIGDAMDDVKCGQQAGGVGILLHHPGINDECCSQADLVIENLVDLIEHMNEGFYVLR